MPAEFVMWLMSARTHSRVLPDFAGYAGNRPEWMKDAACRSRRQSMWFPQGKTGLEAKAICARCPVRDECLRYALEDPDSLMAAVAATSAAVTPGAVHV